jgi:hypothetical protein
VRTSYRRTSAKVPPGLRSSVDAAYSTKYGPSRPPIHGHRRCRSHDALPQCAESGASAIEVLEQVVGGQFNVFVIPLRGSVDAGD